MTDGEKAWVPEAPKRVVSAAQEMLVFTDERDWERPSWTVAQWVVLARVALDAAARYEREFGE
jgi:hypothetical protein